MSQSAAVRTARAARPGARHQLRPVPAPGRPAPPPRLRVVSAQRHTRSRAGLVVVCVAVLAAGLVGLLLLDVSLERGAYDLRDQNVRAEQLREQQQKLEQELQALAAPQNLAAQARRLGMVDAAGAPVFVLPNGRRIGVPQRAVAPSSPTVTATSTAPPAKPTGTRRTPSAAKRPPATPTKPASPRR